MGSQTESNPEIRKWRYSALIENEYTTMTYEERGIDVQCHLAYINRECPLVRWQ
jgi:peroxiredoxin